MGSRMLHLYTLLYRIYSHLSLADAEFFGRGQLMIYSLVARVQMIGILGRLLVIMGLSLELQLRPGTGGRRLGIV